MQHRQTDSEPPILKDNLFGSKQGETESNSEVLVNILEGAGTGMLTLLMCFISA